MSEQFKLFWLSLCDHPGLMWGALWPLMVLSAVSGRKDFVGFSGFSTAAIIGIFVLCLLPWLPIIFTAWTGRHQYKESEHG